VCYAPGLLEKVCDIYLLQVSVGVYFKELIIIRAIEQTDLLCTNPNIYTTKAGNEIWPQKSIIM